MWRYNCVFFIEKWTISNLKSYFYTCEFKNWRKK